jgi:hypothetical protein
MNMHRLLLKGSAYGFLASLIVWSVLGGTMLLVKRSEHDFLIFMVGIPIWAITWIAVGLIVSAATLRGVRPRLAGAVCGVVVGLVSAVLLVNWPNCGYENVIDKIQWAIPYALLTPLLPIFVPLTWLFQHVMSGRIVDDAIGFVSAVIFWGLFGAMLGKLIGRG